MKLPASIAAALGISLSLSLAACGGEPSACSPFESSTVDVEILEPHNGPVYDHASTPGAVRLVDDLPSCGPLEPAFDAVRFDVSDGLPGYVEDCYLSTATAGDISPDVTWYDLEAGDSAPPRRHVLESVFLDWSPFARGDILRPDGCSGVYSVYLSPAVITHEPGGPIDYFRMPAPGEVPPWYVTRVFELGSGCDGLGLAGGTTMCADSWAAVVTAVAPPL